MNSGRPSDPERPPNKAKFDDFGGSTVSTVLAQ